MRVYAAKTKNEIGEIRQFLRMTIEEMNLCYLGDIWVRSPGGGYRRRP